MNGKKIFLAIILALSLALCCFAFACNSGSGNGGGKVDPVEPVTPTTPDDPKPEDDELFKNIVFEDMTVEYDGEYHGVSFGGLPEDCIAEYPAGKGYKNAGEYEINASVSVNGVKKDYSATLTIKKRMLTVVAKEEVAYKNQLLVYEYGISGFVGGDGLDDIDVKPVYNGNANTGANVETQAGAISFTGAEDNNYDFNYVSADLTLEDPSPVFKDGYVYFGKYPQSVLSDQTVIQTLDERIANGLLFADDDTGVICYGGKSYVRKTAEVHAYIDNYRVFSDGSTAERNATYYFTVEPIRWKILSDVNGYFLTTDKLIDVKQFSLVANDTDSNVWGISYLKGWLNGDFAKSAFGGITEGIGEDENGKIRLLTLADVKNVDYGFTDDDARKCYATDYCIASGAFLINEDASGNWWLKDPAKTSLYDEAKVRIVDYNGTCETEGTQYGETGGCYYNVMNKSCCVRPCLTITVTEN